jgi:hypothetical protein
MLAQNATSSALRLAVLLPLIGIGSGCASVSPNVPGADLAAMTATEAVLGDPSGTASLNVEIRGAGRPPEFRKVSLQNGMHVQDALEQTKLTARFRRMNVRIMRPAGDQLAKLDIKYNHQTGRVDPLFDYALHPGDHLVVIEDTTTVLDDMISSLPLPGGAGRGR